MKLIILRGLPGSGKTELANKLAVDLGAEVLHIDYLKTQIMKDFPGQFTWPRVKAMAYDKTIEYLTEQKENGVQIIILEELLQRKSFVDRLQNFCREQGIEMAWFRLKRGMDKLIEVENGSARANRPAHNRPEDFEKIEREIRQAEVVGEIEINNNGSLDETMKEISSRIKGF